MLRGREVWSVRAQECPALPPPVILDGCGPFSVPRDYGPLSRVQVLSAGLLSGIFAYPQAGLRAEDFRGVGVRETNLTFMGFGGSSAYTGA